jgi:hypothetical protein
MVMDHGSGWWYEQLLQVPALADALQLRAGSLSRAERRWAVTCDEVSFPDDLRLFVLFCDLRLLQIEELARQDRLPRSDATLVEADVGRRFAAAGRTQIKKSDPGPVPAGQQKAADISTLADTLAFRALRTHDYRVRSSGYSQWTKVTPCDDHYALSNHFKGLLHKQNCVDIWSMEVYCPIEQVCHLLSAVFATAYCL